MVAAGVMVAGVDYAERVGVALLGCVDGGEEDALAAATGVAEGMEEAYCAIEVVVSRSGRCLGRSGCGGCGCFASPVVYLLPVVG